MVPSPCIDVCDINSASGYCRGCYRSVQEIAQWLMMSDIEKTGVLDMITERRKAQAAEKGFTLLEISIVIGLIAVITASVAIGSRVIDQARLRKQVVQITQLESGIDNFKIKYGCMPGDCLDPSVISGYTYAGNGNAYLGSTWNDDENKGFWLHLSLTKMIEDPLAAHGVLSGMKTPLTVLNKKGYINVYGSITYAQNVLELATDSVNGALKFEEIKHLDTKMDDGVAATGSIRSSGYGSGSTTVYATDPTFPLAVSNKSGSDKCISSGIYSGLATSPYCNMIYLLGSR